MQADRLTEAQTLFYRLLPLIRLLFEEPNHASLNSALAMMGTMHDELHTPMQAASVEMMERLAQELTRLECL
jgi:4-hydroxy-tetrahydrodipicolinate synthase